MTTHDRILSLATAALLAASFILVAASVAEAQTIPSQTAVTQFLPVQSEAEATIRVDLPLAEPLASRGTVIIPYRTDNFRILPIFGAGATDVSPRAGHLHVTVDDLPWHWADAGNTGAIVLAGLPAGPHKVLIEIATPEHKVIGGQAVSFTVPATRHQHH